MLWNHVLARIEAASFVRASEYSLVLLAIAGAFLIPAHYEHAFARLESVFKKFARRPVLSLLAVAAAPVLLRLALLPLMGLPQPGTHDEYSYLLAADTFGHGRVTNPPLPNWKFFESFHILQQPTYASMYPPAQGLFLASGRLLCGQPWAGVLLSMAVLCAALLWMLRGFMPPEWALLSAFLVVLRVGVFSYWANSYWGGAPGAIGGALVAGSIARIFRGEQIRSAIALGLGLVLLAASRPYEGFMFSLPFGLAFLGWLFRGEGSRRRLIRVFLPVAGILLAGAAALAYYDWRITGHPLLTPQMLNARQYAATRLMVWSEDPPTPVYNDAMMGDFYVRMVPRFMDVPHSFYGVLRSLLQKVREIEYFYLGPALFAPLLLVPWVFWNARVRLLVFGLISIGIAFLCIAVAVQPHYFGPAACSLYALVGLAMMTLSKWKWRERPVGRFLVQGLVAAQIAMVGVRILALLLGIENPTSRGDIDRAALASMLNRAPGRFLVIVRYGPHHDPGREWVYNEADLKSAKIVWARDRGAATDTLVQYFPERRAVIVEPDTSPKVVRPYEKAAGPKATL